MSKIVRAVNAMISQQKNISDVVMSENANEFYFLYNKKYAWSITDTGNEKGITLYYYPGETNVAGLADLKSFNGINFVAYSTKEIGTKEAVDSFRELLTLVKEKVFGIDTVIEDIISDDDPPF